MKTQFYSLITDLANHSEDLVCRRVHSQNDYSAPEKIFLKASFKIWKENSGTNLAAHCLRYSTRKKVSKMSMPWSHSIRIHNSIIPSPQLVGLAAQCLCLGEDDMPRSIAAFRSPAQEKWLQWKSVEFLFVFPDWRLTVRSATRVCLTCDLWKSVESEKSSSWFSTSTSTSWLLTYYNHHHRHHNHNCPRHLTESKILNEGVDSPLGISPSRQSARLPHQAGCWLSINQWWW